MLTYIWQCSPLSIVWIVTPNADKIIISLGNAINYGGLSRHDLICGAAPILAVDAPRYRISGVEC